jgi:hypothetical protein
MSKSSGRDKMGIDSFSKIYSIFFLSNQDFTKFFITSFLGSENHFFMVLRNISSSISLYK